MLVSLSILITLRYTILSEMVWWALSNTNLIMWIYLAIHEMLAHKTSIVTDGLISQLSVVTFVYSRYVSITLTCCFPVQLILWKLVHWLWRYKLNEVCDRVDLQSTVYSFFDKFSYCIEENNGPKCFRNIIQWLVRLWNNNWHWHFKIRRLITEINA